MNDYDHENPPPGRSTVTITLTVAGARHDVDTCVGAILENGGLQDLINDAHLDNDPGEYGQMLVLEARHGLRGSAAPGFTQEHVDAAYLALCGLPFLNPSDSKRALESVASAIAAAEHGTGWYNVSGNELATRLTEVMRKADRAFEKVGGSTRHHVRDCLIPELEEAGLKVVALPSPPSSQLPAGETER
jgi:hypothetical protein